VQHAIIISLLVCQFAIFAGIFWSEVLRQAWSDRQSAAGEFYIFNGEGRLQSGGGRAFVVREGSMTDLHETNPKRTAQIDTIGWVIVVVTAIAATVTVSHIVGPAS
jgi:hypothetical protein